MCGPKHRPNGITRADREVRKSEDLLKREFKSREPLKKCITDITEIKARDGKLYVSAIFDCFDAAVLGMAMDTNMKAVLCERTLTNVLPTMRPLTENGEWGAKQKKIYDIDENGEKITPKQWKAEIQSLQSEYDSISKEQNKTATELAYAEVISYNKKNLERELQNESRQQNRQQEKVKRREEEI